jgi:hypothetical protein
MHIIVVVIVVVVVAMTMIIKHELKFLNVKFFYAILSLCQILIIFLGGHKLLNWLL